MAQLVKTLSAMQKTWVWSLGWEDHLEKGMATHSSILAMGQRSLAGYSPGDHKGSDMTEWLSLHLQCVKNFQIDDGYQATDPGSTDSTREDKYESIYTQVYHIQTTCCRQNVCIPQTQEFIFWNLTTSVMVFRARGKGG